jgi:septum site-determining protein MinC
MQENALPPVQIKANRDGFMLLPDPVASFATIMQYLTQKLADSHHFLKRTKMTLDLRQRPFRAEEIQVLRQVLLEKGEIELAEVWLGSDLGALLNWASQQLGTPLVVPRNEPQEPMPVIVRMTCRSGMRIDSNADCIILGDVNPGAEVSAAGDVIVFGRLRGTAHAGNRGNRAARIWASSIEPNQIRIADLVAVSPRETKKNQGRFEMAEIRGESIQVTTL